MKYVCVLIPSCNLIGSYRLAYGSLEWEVESHAQLFYPRTYFRNLPVVQLLCIALLCTICCWCNSWTSHVLLFSWVLLSTLLVPGAFGFPGLGQTSSYPWRQCLRVQRQ